MKSGIIQIAYALDDRFAEMTCVSIASVLANTSSDVVFHIFESRLADIHKKKLSELVDGHPHGECCFYHIDIDDDTYVTAEVTKVTKETYTKTMLPELLVDIDRVIWLDGDTIVEKDIVLLWQVDLGDALVGMVPDYSMEPKDEKKVILGMEDSSYYYNTGIILMNLPRLREIYLSGIVAENVIRLHKQVLNVGLNWYAEQDVLNFALRGKIKTLPMRFNSYFWISLLLGESLEECVEVYLNPVIVHFIGTPKPTELGKVPVNVPEWERYYKYKALSPYADDADAEKISIYKKREDNTLNALTPVLNDTNIHWYSDRFAERIFSLIMQRYVDAVNDKKIAIWGLNIRTWTLIVYLAANGVEVWHIVDGLEKNQGVMVFNHCVVSPDDILRDTVEDAFVMIDIHQREMAQSVMARLRTWGYKDESFCHVYAPIWDGI